MRPPMKSKVTPPIAAPNRCKRTGVVLFAVLIVVAILMLAGYQFLNLMNVEYEAARAAAKVAQARRLADSGLHYAAYILSHPASAGLNSDGSMLVAPAMAYDNPSLFHQRPVTDAQGNVLGYFSLVSPRDSSDPLGTTQGFRFGVEDEGGKINLNAALKIDKTGSKVKEALGTLPNVTPDIASSLLNWMRSPDAQDSSGDSTYYASMGYSQKYGPYESFEELLLVRGVTPRVLLGNDRNRNGILEADEDDAGGVLDHGLSTYLTVYSREMNVNAQGQPRVWVNNTDLSTCYSQLSSVVGADLAGFMVIARQYGLLQRGARVTPAPNETVTGGPKEVKLDAVAADKLQKINSLWDLVDARVLVTETPQGGGPARRVLYNSPLKKSDMTGLAQALPVLLDNVSTTNALDLPARVNVLTAPAELIRALPLLTQADIENILQNRPNANSDPSQASAFNTLAWLVTLANFDPTTLSQLEPYLTTRSQVFRVQAVGYYELNGPAVRLEAVIDANGGRPRFLYWRDLSDLGRGFNFSPGGSVAP